MKSFFLSILLFICPFLIFGQVITVTPAFPTVNDTVTIVYDATQGNAALVGVTPVYIHTGVISNYSTSATDWKHVQLLPWPTNAAKLLMTDLGNNKHQIKFHIATYYGLTDPNEVVSKLAFVFRNGAGTVVGKDANGADIYYNVYSGSSINVGVSSPQNGSIINLNSTVTLTANASIASDLSLYLNNNLVQSATNASTVAANVQATTAGQYWVKIVANNGGNIITDSIYYLVQGSPIFQNPPAGTIWGVQALTGSSVRFALNTPYSNKSWIYVIGDFNNWLPTPATEMKRSPDGKKWWVDVTVKLISHDLKMQK